TSDPPTGVSTSISAMFAVPVLGVANRTKRFRTYHPSPRSLEV
ncbi:6387_t:CDS:1, partial [Acaulospora colombiana]